jgi:hypothetical protein
MSQLPQWKNNRLNTGNIDIQITNRHIYHDPGVWVMHVRELGWSAKPIGIQPRATEQEAQAAAIQKVADFLLLCHKELVPYLPPTQTDENVLQ